MGLFVERGYDNVTVAEIAERAGLTERTFFRHFADKREVLFSGSELLQQLLAEQVEAAPPDAGPLAAVGVALEAAGAQLQQRAAFAPQRQALILANAELRERDLIKHAALARAVADGLRRRGVKQPTADLAAEAGMAAFRVAWERWLERPQSRNLPKLIRQSMDQLRALT
jgi:AcrR family transcriptional regulator